MACISTATKTAIEATITALEASLVIATAAYNSALVEIEEYRFDSAEGSQRAKRHDPEKLWRQIENITAKIDRLNRRLNGSGVINLNVRRR